MDIILERGQSDTRNRVLRNTYWLLALSLIPTVLGSWVGVAMGFGAFVASSPLIWFGIFMVVAFGLMFAIQATKNSIWGIPLLLLLTGFMGFSMSPLLGVVLGKANGVGLITLAAGGTALIFAVMATLSSVIKRDISSWGKFLMVGLIAILIGMVANIWLQLTALALTLSVLAVCLFSAFLLYDLKRIVDGGETNYITATLSVYLSLINIFQNLLSILNLTSSNND